jgi:chorismate-pyruvate lyase
MSTQFRSTDAQPAALPASARCRPPGAEDVDPATLPGILRVLLVTDGTVTETLEAWFGEPTEVTGVCMTETDGVVRREVVLAGTCSGRRFVHAESTIGLADLAGRLDGCRGGIGQALREMRLPTYRDIEDRWREAAAGHAAALNCAADAALIGRRYGIWINAGRAIEIVERFPLDVYRASESKPQGFGARR